MMSANSARAHEQAPGQMEGETSGTRLRKAITADVIDIQRLVNGFADRGLMLHRSLSQLYENVRDFYVVERDQEIVGCSALHVTWRDLAEIKSLAVAEHMQGCGLGRALIHACVEEAAALGIRRVFALTYVPKLFEKQGFRIAERSELPRKVWTECVHCPKFADCGEIAVVRELADGPFDSPVSVFPLELTQRLTGGSGR